MEPIQTLYERSCEGETPSLADALRAEYGGDLRFPAAPPNRPLVVANFVSTLDGVTSFDIPGKSGGAPISGANRGDRFIMGLLRASADAVLVGSGTVEAVSHNHVWVAEYIFPQAADRYREYRQTVLGKPRYPLNVIISGTGRLDLTRAVFHTPEIAVLVLTTEAGRRGLAGAGVGALSTTAVRVLPAEGGKLLPWEILRILHGEFGARLILHEGGPMLLGQFLADGLVDELCLTLAPQIAGRMEARFRPALIMNTEFGPDTAPWLNLLSVKRGGDHLYLRYRRTGPRE
jgi:riboflavin biosynthesis pyrimidine reductase